jgi:phosphoserine phosphatase RsbU/P
MHPSDNSDPEVRRLQQEVGALRGAVAELTVLNEISREIGALVDLDEVLRRIVERSVAAVGAEEGVITLVADDPVPSGQTLVRSMATDVHRGPFHLNEQILGWMQLYRAPLRVGHAAGDERFRLVASQSGVNALLSVPLLTRGRLVGVLTVCNRKDGGAFGETDQRLLTIIGSQSAQIIENARLYEEEQKLREMQEELRVAFQIQTRLLPAAAPIVDGYDLAGLSIPAQAVGGDFFDYISINPARLVVCVGDVSGKGLPAALLMATAQATIRGQAVADKSPAGTIARVNGHIYRSIKRGNFLTLFYGELLSEENVFRYVNAGHNRPLVMRSDGAIEDLRDGGVAIGLVPAAAYEEGHLALNRGDVLVIYSDGVTEARNAAREEFGEGRLADAIRRHSGGPAAALLERIIADVDSFVDGADASDDLTLLAVIRT